MTTKTDEARESNAAKAAKCAEELHSWFRNQTWPTVEEIADEILAYFPDEDVKALIAEAK